MALSVHSSVSNPQSRISAVPLWQTVSSEYVGEREEVLVGVLSRLLSTAENINALGGEGKPFKDAVSQAPSVNRKSDCLIPEIQRVREQWLKMSEQHPELVSQLAEMSPFVELFESMADKLAMAYGNLEERVHRLTGELTSEIEHRKEELEAREKATRRLQTLLHLLPAGVVLIDGHGVIQMCNAAAIDLLGEPLESETWLDVIQRCFAPRRDDGHEVSLKDGRRVSISIRSIEQEPGQLILLSDLTETRELQSRLSRYERLSAMGRMVASLAHQIRTPLSTAMLYAGHLGQSHMEDDLRVKCADKLMSRLVHLEQQVRDMLIFAKGETPLAEKMTLSLFEGALRHAIEAPVSRAGAKVFWQNSVGEMEILCNREALIGAFLNLVNNSIESGPSGVEIRIEIKRETDKQIAIEVSDNGSGFAPGMKPKIKEAFYTTKSQGTGLGLPVVMAVAKAHKGTFDIDSNGVGATARMILPTVTNL